MRNILIAFIALFAAAHNPSRGPSPARQVQGGGQSGLLRQHHRRRAHYESLRRRYRREG